jgi:hypothetical protein
MSAAPLNRLRPAPLGLAALLLALAFAVAIAPQAMARRGVTAACKPASAKASRSCARASASRSQRAARPSKAKAHGQTGATAPAPVGTPAPTPAPLPTLESAPTPVPGPEPLPAPDGEATPAPAEAPSVPSAVPASPSSIYWGAWIGKQLTGQQPPWDMSAVTKLGEMAGKKLSIVQFAAPFANCPTSGGACSFYNFPANEFNSIRSQGAVPFYSWSSQSIPSTKEEPDFQLADVISGRYDAYIRKFAEAAKAWGHPFFLRFDWEMNGSWFPWSEGVNGNKPGEFVTAWRHVHDIFTSVGATNATWVWCPNVDFTRKLIPLNKLYPGKKYVDWTCMDGLNWGKHSDSIGWQNFNQVFSETYHRILKIAPEKPMLLGEVASNEKGGSKPAWIKNMLNVIRRYRKLRGLIWFDVKDRNTHWPLESSKQAGNAFAKGISRNIYRPNEFGALGTTSPIPPPSWP